MSAISGSGASQMSQMLQQMQQGGGPSAMLKQMPAEFQGKIESAAQSAGVDPSQFSAMQQDLQSAFQSVEPGEDPRDAIGAVFDQYGVDPSEMKAQMQSIMDSMGVSPQGGQGAYGFNAASLQNDLLSVLTGGEDNGASSDGDLSELLNSMNGLPAGSLINQTA